MNTEENKHNHLLKELSTEYKDNGKKNCEVEVSCPLVSQLNVLPEHTFIY